jgi:hypothetical protein
MTIRQHRKLRRTDADWTLPGQPRYNSSQILGGMGYLGLSTTDLSPRAQIPQGKSLDVHQEHLCAHFHSPTDRMVLRPQAPPHPRCPSDIIFRRFHHHREGSRRCHPSLHHPTDYVPAPAAETSYEKPLANPTSRITNNPSIRHNPDCSLQPMVTGGFHQIPGHQEDGPPSRSGHHCPPESPLVCLFLRIITPAIRHFRISTPTLSPR